MTYHLYFQVHLLNALTAPGIKRIKILDTFFINKAMIIDTPENVQ